MAAERSPWAAGQLRRSALQRAIAERRAATDSTAGRASGMLAGAHLAVPRVEHVTRDPMDLRGVLIEIHEALREAGVDHALIGGLALAAHGAARATVDLDLLADGARSDDVDQILRSRGYDCLQRTVHVANYASPEPARGRVDFLFALRERGKAILARAAERQVFGGTIRVADASDLIGLKVQSSSNDPSRLRRDLADIERLLETGQIDLGRVREYFRLFDREQELDALLAERRSR